MPVCLHRRACSVGLALVVVGCASAPEPLPVSLPATAAPSTACAESTQTRILKGTPAIPAALEQRLQQYLNTRSASMLDLSPDGEAILIGTRFAETSQVHLVRQPLGARTQLSFGDEPVASARFVPGHPDLVTLMTDVGGNEQYQVSVLDLKSGRSLRLTDGSSRNPSYRWSDDGTRLAVASNRRNGRDMDLWLIERSDPPKARMLMQNEGHWEILDWSRDGTTLLVQEYISIADTRLYLVDVGSGQSRRLSPSTATTAYRAAVLTPDATRVYVATDREGDFVELYDLDLATDQWTPLTRDIPWNVEGLALSRDGSTLAFTVNAEGYSSLYLLDTAQRERHRVDEIPRGLIGNLVFGRQRPVLALTLQGPTETGDAFLYDLRTRTLARWTESELGGLDASRFVEPELIHYASFDGRQIPAFYYRPAGPGPFPVVVMIHGGPEAQARPVFSALTQYLVLESGMAVLVPNVRGSDGYGKEYLRLDNGLRREDSVRDIGALLDWVRNRDELDARRAGVLGGSYGGYMVLAALVHYGDRLRAGVDVVGISNFVTFLENTQTYRRDLRRAEYGDERDPAMRAHLIKISPSTQAQRIRSALFVAHGANDPRVPLGETDQIVEAVRRQGQDVWYMVATNEGHGFRRKENRDAYLSLAVLFFEQQLVEAQRP
ncbi:MAG: S9 family peptidase [Pseudomonadota bacterium]